MVTFGSREETAKGRRIESFILRDERWRPLQLPDGATAFLVEQGRKSLWAMTKSETYRYLVDGEPTPEVADLDGLKR